MKWAIGLLFLVLSLAVMARVFLVPPNANAKDAFAELEHDMENTIPDHDEDKSTARQKQQSIMSKMDALAKASVGTPDGANVAIQTITWSWMLDIDLPHLLDRFELIVEHYPNHPDVSGILEATPMAYKQSRTKEEWISTLQLLAKSTKIDYTRQMSLQAIGLIHMADNDLTQAKIAFDQIIKTPNMDPDMIEAAKGFIYEIDHLQVGMEAPAFATKTLDGQDVSLNSFRGKAILLNFWASW